MLSCRVTLVLVDRNGDRNAKLANITDMPTQVLTPFTHSIYVFLE